MRGWYSPRAAGYRAVHAAGLRAALDRLRLRARPPADAAAVRAGHRPAAVGRRRTGSGPEPATDAELRLVPRAGIPRGRPAVLGGPVRVSRGGDRDGGDCPPFAGMHEASAAVAGGSIRAMEAILRGDVEHAFHPGGGLHHAMRERASGFCIYNDPALAIARARRDGLRVLYIDLDVHHGDGVQALLLG